MSDREPSWFWYTEEDELRDGNSGLLVVIIAVGCVFALVVMLRNRAPGRRSLPA
jgi:hypothetical protein